MGANIGYYPCLWATAKKQNQAVAFEASSRNVRLLRQNVEQNSFNAQITVSPKAIGRDEGTLSFDPGPDVLSGQGSFAVSDESRAITVAQTTLDAVFASTDAFIDVLKIDIEGADTWALEGARQLLEDQRIGHIFFEQYRHQMEHLDISPDRAHELLAACGYRIEHLGGEEYYASVE